MKNSKLLCILFALFSCGQMSVSLFAVRTNDPNEREIKALEILVRHALITESGMDQNIIQSSKEEVANARRIIQSRISLKQISSAIAKSPDPSMDNILNDAIEIFKDGCRKKRNHERELAQKKRENLTPEELEELKHKHSEESKKSQQKRLKNFTPEELEEWKRKHSEATKKSQQKRRENLTPEGLEELRRKQNEVLKKSQQKRRKSLTPEELEKWKRKHSEVFKKFRQKKLENLTPEELEELERHQCVVFLYDRQ
ncbi:MAG: hypothetical protein LBI37_01290, partial [Puniceicoccales bacterium]|nr:hypothetical protein [Puniceicoccales bacterium]